MSTEREAINAETVPFLLSARGRVALAALQETDLHPQRTLTILQGLRREFAAAEAGALLALARLRQRARSKFPDAERLFFTAEALEQATAWPIARRRAAWLADLVPAGPILDLGCGIGGDLLALAHERPVVGIDQDPVRLQLAAANAEALGVSDQVTLIQADWTELRRSGQLPEAAVAFADPARRAKGKRLFRLHQLQPPVAELLALQREIHILGVKVMPGVEDRDLPPNCAVEFISHDGVCKEAVLWFGNFAPLQRWATVATPQGWQRVATDGDAPPQGDLENIRYLHEPDPAVIRARALGRLCYALNAHLFDSQIAYLVSAVYHEHPLVQSFRIDEIHPFQLKLLNRRLQALKIGQVELKKRGFPVAPEELRPRLKLVKSGQAGVVIFTRRGNQRLMLIGRRIAPA